MNRSDDFDRERRRVKPSKRRNWAKRLMSPKTLEGVIKIARMVTPLVRIILDLIKLFRD